MSAERLQKVLASAGIASRRDCEELISAGRVSVNGKVVTVAGSRVDPEEDEIAVDGQPIGKINPRTYVMLNKPVGVVSTADDPQGRPTVVEMVDLPARLFPVGRLDYDSEGLLLMTDDGELTQRLTHPSYQIEKEYRALLDQPPSPDALREWRNGVELDDAPTAPAWVDVLERTDEGTWVRVVLHEGRKRQIREVAKLLGYEVLRLIRVREGPILLGDLPAGEWRKLTDEQLEALWSHVGGRDAEAREPERAIAEVPVAGRSRRRAGSDTAAARPSRRTQRAAAPPEEAQETQEAPRRSRAARADDSPSLESGDTKTVEERSARQSRESQRSTRTDLDARGPRRDDARGADDRGSRRDGGFDSRGSSRDDRGGRYDSRAPRRDDRGSRYDSRGPSRDNRGGFDSRGPSRDDRGSRYDSRGPSRDNRGGFDSRGPSRDDRGGRYDSRAPRRDDRSGFDSRGPSRDDRGSRYDSRGPSRDSRGSSRSDSSGFDSRGPSRDNRGSSRSDSSGFDSRGPARDNRGRYDSRGPARDNRGRYDSRGPARDNRGGFERRPPRRDDRGGIERRQYGDDRSNRQSLDENAGNSDRPERGNERLPSRDQREEKRSPGREWQERTSQERRASSQRSGPRADRSFRFRERSGTTRRTGFPFRPRPRREDDE